MSAVRKLFSETTLLKTDLNLLNESLERSKSELILLDAIFDKLFPICRSITGPGFRESLNILKSQVPFETLQFKSGSQVFDWQVPQEWHVQDAFIIDPSGNKICDLKENNLHLVNYSEPIEAEISLDDLQKHLHSIPSLPDAIPYVTSYYKRTWGFCLSENQRKQLKQGKYQVIIKTKFVDGHVEVGECLLPGILKTEVLLSTYLCHPSLANNELSGPLVQMALYNRIKNWKSRKLTYRFSILPETIGSICYLSQRGLQFKNDLLAGFVLTCLGGKNKSLSYKMARNENCLVNNLIKYLIGNHFEEIRIREFTPVGGSDERQYNSPGFDLPVGQFARDIYGEYEGYHNSLDTKEFMGVKQLIASVDQIERILLDLEYSVSFENQSPYGEVQLGRRGLYPNMNSHTTRSASDDSQIDGREQLNRILMILNYSDKKHSLLEIAKKLNVRPSALEKQVLLLEEQGLLKPVEDITK